MKRAIAITLLFSATGYAAEHDFIAEHAGAGATAQVAQPHIDAFLRQLETASGWPAKSSKGVWADDEQAMEKGITEMKPGFAIMDPEVYLALRKKNALEPIASIRGATFNKGHYNLVVKNAAFKTLANLKGKKVISNHVASPRYINKVAFDGKVDVEKNFVLEKAVSPLKPLRQVLSGDADAALIDDEQLARMKDLDGGDALKVIWKSAALPPTPVVAFEKLTTPADRKKVADALQKMCADPKGKPICDEMSVDKFAPVDKTAFVDAAKKYDAASSK